MSMPGGPRAPIHWHTHGLSKAFSVKLRCKIIRMKSKGKRESNARLLPCLCVPRVFSHRTSPGASTRKSNRNRILSDSDSFILVVRFAAGRARPRASMQSAATRAQVGTKHAAARAQVNEQGCERASKVQQHERKTHHTGSNTSASKHHPCKNTSASKQHTCSNTSASKTLEARRRHAGFLQFPIQYSNKGLPRSATHVLNFWYSAYLANDLRYF